MLLQSRFLHRASNEQRSARVAQLRLLYRCAMLVAIRTQLLHSVVMDVQRSGFGWRVQKTWGLGNGSGGGGIAEEECGGVMGTVVTNLCGIA